MFFILYDTGPIVNKTELTLRDHSGIPKHWTPSYTTPQQLTIYIKGIPKKFLIKKI